MSDGVLIQIVCQVDDDSLAVARLGWYMPYYTQKTKALACKNEPAE
jgi:ATP-dependent RNA circularization protein (DNA/RNA ligase family)